MKMNLENQIDLYVMGKMPVPEMEQFQQRILVDSDLAVRVRKRELMHLGLSALGSEKMKQRIKSVRQEMLGEDNLPKEEIRKSKNFTLRYLMAAAATITFLLLAWQLFSPKQSSAEKLFTKNYQPYSTNLNSRASNDSKGILLLQKLYEEKKYQDVIPLLEKLSEQQPNNSDMTLMLGNSYLSINQIDKAINSFTSIMERKDPLYADAAQWYLALCYLNKNEFEKTKENLMELTQDTNADFYEEAKELLEDMN